MRKQRASLVYYKATVLVKKKDVTLHRTFSLEQNVDKNETCIDILRISLSEEFNCELSKVNILDMTPLEWKSYS